MKKPLRPVEAPRIEEDPRRLRGTITTILTGKGYGWISGESEQEYYFHFSGVDAEWRVGRGLDLAPGDMVTFLVVATARGARAVKVRKG